MAIDAKGKIQGGDRQNVELKLRPQTRQAVEAAGFRLLSRLVAAPGPLPVARRRTGGGDAGRSGSVYYDLEVPDFSKEPFSMSGLVVSSNFAAMTPTARADEQLKDVLKTPPTTARDFSVADTLCGVRGGVRQPGATPHQVDITTTLRADDGRVGLQDRGTAVERRTAGGARRATATSRRSRSQTSRAGQYVLRVEAQSRLSGSNAGRARNPGARRGPCHSPRPHRSPRRHRPRRSSSVARGPQSEVDDVPDPVARNDEEWQALWSSLPMRRPRRRSASRAR